MTEILVPPLSQTSDSLLFTGWYKARGELVVKGEPLFSVETDKSTLDVEAPASGTLVEITAQAGDEIKIGSSIGQIITESDAGTPPRRFASPRARQLAREAQIPLEKLQGSGPQQAVIARDVQNAIQAQAKTAESTPNPATPLSSPLSTFRRSLTQRLLTGAQERISVTYFRSIDVSHLVKMRRKMLETLSEGSPRPTLTDYLALLLCQVLRDHPEFNATLEGERLTQFSKVHLAVAVDTPRGLMAPVIRNADQMNLMTFAQRRVDLIEKAMGVGLLPEMVTGGTFTLSNLGSTGVDFFTPVINPPQVAILGIGAMKETPLLKKKKLVNRKFIGLALTCDHRVIDGLPAAHFLEELDHLVQNPSIP